MSTPASAPQTPHPPSSSFSSSIQPTHAPPPPPPGPDTLTPLEQEILDEYARLLDNMNT
ncbi:MAG: hypothetical protein M1835_001500, partial [Candelina submexicana]